MTLLLKLTLALSVAVLSWMFGDGVQGLVTLALYLVAVSVGLPFGFLLFGRGGAAWAAGALIGYGLLSVGFWIPIMAGWVRPGAFFYAWLMLLLLGGTMRSVCKGITPLSPLAEWTRRDSATLLLLLHVVPLLAASSTPGPTRDLVGQTARAGQLARFEPGLADPYFLPATVIGARGEARALAHVDGALKITALLSALLLLSMIYVAAWVTTSGSWPAAAGAVFAITVASIGPAWPPQAMSAALGLIALVAAARGTVDSTQGLVFAAAALALSASFHPWLGAILCAVSVAVVLLPRTAR